VHVRGANTIGENIADLGGLSAAHEAYRISLHGAQAPVLDGYTGEQRVFLGWGQAWRENIREAALRTRIVSDEHSPAEFRVNGVVRNLDAWYDAFGIAPASKFYLAPGERVRIW
jgi:putative endopeptidase